MHNTKTWTLKERETKENPSSGHYLLLLLLGEMLREKQEEKELKMKVRAIIGIIILLITLKKK
jgi:hypothetical protein